MPRLHPLLLTTALALLSATAPAQPPALVDTHAHFQTTPVRDLEGSKQSALAEMDKQGIARSLLMPQPFSTLQAKAHYDVEDLLFAAKTHPGRFAVLGGSSLNIMIHGTPAENVDAAVTARFRARAEQILALGAVGFGEIAIHHVSIPAMGSRHAYERVAADHPLLLLLADIAAEHDVPVDLHFDLVPEDMPLPEALRPNPLNPATLEANVEAFKRLLAYNPKTKFVWSHVGFEPLLTRIPKRVRLMLQEHPNLYMSFRLNRGHPSPAAALDGEGKVKPIWVALISDFPDRFMLGSDAFYDRNGIYRGSSEQGIGNLRALIAELPDGVAKAVANGNANRLYHLDTTP
jgi:predicted TIM-barrel fold metal-dependent hydrolase